MGPESPFVGSKPPAITRDTLYPGQGTTCRLLNEYHQKSPTFPKIALYFLPLETVFECFEKAWVLYRAGTGLADNLLATKTGLD